MSTNKSTTATNKAMVEANAAAIKAKFPKAALLAQFKKMADGATDESKASELKAETAYVVCTAAHDFSDAAYGTGNGQTDDRTTILAAWRGHWPVLIKELHAKQNPFVELGEPNKKGEQKPIMTGYGRNVASAARGVIEYDVPVKNEAGTAYSFREIQSAVQEARRKANPSDIRAAREALTEAITALRKRLGSDVAFTEVTTAILAYINEQVEAEGLIALTAFSLMFEDVDLQEYLTVPDDDTSEDADIDNEATSDDIPEVQAA